MTPKQCCRFSWKKSAIKFFVACCRPVKVAGCYWFITDDVNIENFSKLKNTSQSAKWNAFKPIAHSSKIVIVTPFSPHDAICCHRVSVCLSVCLSQVGVLQRWLNLASHKQHHTIAYGLLVFWWQKSRRNSNGIIPDGIIPNSTSSRDELHVADFSRFIWETVWFH